MLFLGLKEGRLEQLAHLQDVLLELCVLTLQGSDGRDLMLFGVVSLGLLLVVLVKLLELDAQSFDFFLVAAVLFCQTAVFPESFSS